jgi:hypothetical protein
MYKSIIVVTDAKTGAVLFTTTIDIRIDAPVITNKRTHVLDSTPPVDRRGRF